MLTVTDLVIILRGGLPETCDFCGQLFSDTRQPVPEEAQAWACSECVARWEETPEPLDDGDNEDA